MTEQQKDQQKFFYANGLETILSDFDCNLKFIRQGTSSTDPVPAGFSQNNPVSSAVLDSITVAVSPSLAKIVLVSLYDAIKRYEDANGEIQLPVQFAELYKKTFNLS